MSHEAHEDDLATKNTTLVFFVAKSWTVQASVTSMAADVSL